MAKEVLALKILGTSPAIPSVLETKYRKTALVSQPSWRRTAPMKPALYPLGIKQTDTGETMMLNIFVMPALSAIKNFSFWLVRACRWPGFSGPMERLRVWSINPLIHLKDF